MASNKWRVLIVEDDHDSVELVIESLRLYRADIEVRPVMNGEDCLAQIASFKPSVVILDLALPGMNGWQLLDAIRRENHLADLPVIAITGFGSVEVQDQALRSGFTGYFSKPIDVTSFGAQLDTLLSAS